MSLLRARCPDCRTLTAVAVEDEYECHACGRVFRAGLVRVPRAWGDGGLAMVEAASLPLDYPEAAVVDEPTLPEQLLSIASQLPERPLVLGGCCCCHVGAVEALAARHGRLALLWLDAHGDLNTPETSPTGNLWGMPLRMLIDHGAVQAGDVALVGARELDPPEEEFIERSAVNVGFDGVDRALADTAALYVAIDCDAFDERDMTPFMPESGGLRLDEAEALLERARASARLVGAGLSGLTPAPSNIGPAERLCRALGL